MDQRPGLERRRSERIPATLDMQIYAYGVLMASGVTVEVSDHGLLIRIEQDYSADELDPGKHLDIMMEPLEGVCAEQWLPVTVVRKWEEGIAARFIGMDMTKPM